MTNRVLTYLATALVMLGCDSVWLTLTSGPLYRASLGDLLLTGFRPVPAAAFYVLYVFGVQVFAIAPARAARRWTLAAAQGALLGLVAYSTYDLTNQATLRVWSTAVTLADMAWGTVLTALAATGGYLASQRLR